ncbi:RraA family protein [Paenibacillus abyssi]|uniref:Putative 4-hydroxy-4-methyl-2-oxoglutarate aldolase n=1 Tax=Paenibacillus abyssi TaxID=1340531 RepID=A0A917FN54_9BACL|nr:RraA family protein [Paenibacillus abyssi]GGF90707.1 4-carboxy-4-hydroxy-2-oxoadipate aldolase/oxaloacetate decarboxylase [Paenibacillus abyssi]
MSADDRKELLELYKDFRVTDVRDGMDWMGMHHYGTVSKDIKPLWRTKIVGIARTARYLPFEGPVPKLTPEEYTEWSRWYYKEVCYDPWHADIVDGDIMVMDVSGCDVGIMGSNNTLTALLNGCRGYITNGGGIRDTDEVVMQNIPVWSKFVSQGMDQGRIRFDTKDIPVAIGGVAVYPGDVIVADGDGVIVVPRKMAYDVAKYANQEMKGDKVGRRKLYEKLGWAPDETVQV